MTDGYTPYQLLTRTDKVAANLVPEDDIVWMQWTGLRDAHDQDIYELDVLHHAGWDLTFTVRWSDELAGFIAITADGDLLASEVWPETVITGNALANPEPIKNIE